MIDSFEKSLFHISDFIEIQKYSQYCTHTLLRTQFASKFQLVFRLVSWFVFGFVFGLVLGLVLGLVFGFVLGSAVLLGFVFGAGRDVLGVFGFAFVGHFSFESGVRIGRVGDDLLTAVGKNDVVRSSDDLTVTRFLATVVVVLVLDFISKVVWVLGFLKCKVGSFLLLLKQLET